MKKIGIFTLVIVLAVGMIGFTGLDNSQTTTAKVATLDVVTQLDLEDYVEPGTVLEANITYGSISIVYGLDDYYYQTDSLRDHFTTCTVLADPQRPTNKWQVIYKDIENTTGNYWDIKIALVPVDGGSIIEKHPAANSVLKGDDAKITIPDYTAARDFSWYRQDDSIVAINDIEPYSYNFTDASITMLPDNSLRISDIKSDVSPDGDNENYWFDQYDLLILSNPVIVEFDYKFENMPDTTFENEAFFISFTEPDSKYEVTIFPNQNGTKKIALPKGTYDFSIKVKKEVDTSPSSITISPLRITEYINVGAGQSLTIPVSDTVNYKTTNKFVCMVDNWQFTNPVSLSLRDAQKVTKITTPKSTISLKNKKSYTIPVKAYANGISKPNLAWKSSNPKIATVNQNGKVTAKKTGKVTITATAENDKKIKITVRVVKKNIKAKKISVSGHKKTMKKGKVAYLKVKTNPINATANKVTFKSSKKKVLTVDKYGKITAKKKGTAKITVKAGGKKKVITIKVK